MTPWQILDGDCLERLRELPDASVDAVITDPPYGLSAEPDVAEVLGHWLRGDDYVHRGGGFMGKSWDSFVPGPTVWAEALRVLKPGGHLLAFFGTRTQDLGSMAIRLAGFEIRDTIAWLYGSGFPKSLDVSKAIDKAAGAERPRTQRGAFGGTFSDDDGTTYGTVLDSNPITPEAAEWQGWGTALKPAFEPIAVARKPLGDTVAANVLKHGTGALNIDGCRIGFADAADESERKGKNRHAAFGSGPRTRAERGNYDPPGRWPANVTLDEEAAAVLDEEAGELTSGASRFYYCAKASTAERDTGLGGGREHDPETATPKRNVHPTVKPIDVMRWLVRLVTPPGGTILDPFTGSGTTGIAAIIEGFTFIGIERETEYAAIARTRIQWWQDHRQAGDELRDTIDRETRTQAYAAAYAADLLDLLDTTELDEATP